VSVWLRDHKMREWETRALTITAYQWSFRSRSATAWLPDNANRLGLLPLHELGFTSLKLP
jgi:hypothetical protein